MATIVRIAIFIVSWALILALASLTGLNFGTGELLLSLVLAGVITYGVIKLRAGRRVPRK